MKDQIVTYGEAAEEFGASYETISNIARGHGLTPKPVPRNGNAKGLDRKDMAVIRKALGLRKGERLTEKPVPAAAV